MSVRSDVVREVLDTLVFRVLLELDRAILEDDETDERDCDDTGDDGAGGLLAVAGYGAVGIAVLLVAGSPFF